MRNPLPVVLSPFAASSTPVVDFTTAANASCIATIATSATQYGYLSQIIVGGLGATGAAAVSVTISLSDGDDVVFPIQIPAGATTAFTPIVISFAVPLRSALGADITVTVGAAGAGNTRIDVTAIGFVSAT